MFRTALVVLMFLLTPTAALAAKPVGNLYNVAVPTRADGSTLTLQEIRNAIFAGCAYKGWTPRTLDENRIRADITVRSHWAEITIGYDEKAYSIVYSNSRNLDYNPGKETIHRNFNKWLILLSQAIQAEMVRSK